MILTAQINDTDLSVNDLKRYRRKKRILDLLYHNKLLSATQLCHGISSSLPTVIGLVNELIECGLVVYCGEGASKGGRRPALFGLKQNSIYIIVCELGRLKGKIAVFNEHNQQVCSSQSFTSAIDDEELIEKILKNTQTILNENYINITDVYGLGISMPGLVDEQTGTNYTIKNERFRNVKKGLSDKFDGFVYVNNDARMQAYGEFVFGSAQGVRDALIINWDRGIGLGMILNGKVYNGASGFAGELSHIRYAEKGALCICGKRGCLETVASVDVLLTKARSAVEAGNVSQLTLRFKNRLDELEVEDILTAARSGDELSISLLDEVSVALGKVLANTIQLLNPEVIVLGGVLSGANQFILNPIQQAINKYCLEQISKETKILISNSWEQSGLLGLTAMLFQKLFSDMYLKFTN